MEKNENNYLIIEDNEVDILIANNLIQSHYPSLQPIITSNGAQALKVLNERIAKGFNNPAFILLDLFMPFMNGFDFLEIYERELFKKLKMPNVFILTSSIHEIDKRKAAKYQSVKAYLIKPFNINEFVNINH